MSRLGKTVVEAVAQALSCAVDSQDRGTKFNNFNSSVCLNIPGTFLGKKRRGAEESKKTITVFDSSAIPPIDIDKYLKRLASTFRCSDAAFVAALIIVDRLLEYDGGRLPLTKRNVHRVYLGSLLVAVKYHEDLVYSNSHYAKAGGVHLREVNRLERVLLMALDWDLRVTPEQYQLYEAMLMNATDTMKLPPSLGSPECFNGVGKQGSGDYSAQLHECANEVEEAGYIMVEVQHKPPNIVIKPVLNTVRVG